MDKTITGLLGAAAALTTLTAAQAKPVEPAGLPPATSYADLLQPIPNALALQKADDARRREAPSSGDVQLAQWFREHHHHHHHRYGPWRSYRYYYDYGGYYPRYRYRYRYHHHHHHHHHRYYRYDRW